MLTKTEAQREDLDEIENLSKKRSKWAKPVANRK